MADAPLSPDDMLESAATDDSTPAAGNRITTGRIVTWILIAALAAVTGLEAVAKFGYDGTLQALEALNIDASDTGVELAEVDQGISGWTSREVAPSGVIVIRWVSLLKDYEVRLVPEPQHQGRIAGFETPDAAVAEIEAPSLPPGFVLGELPPNPSSAPAAGGKGLGDALKIPPPAVKKLSAPPRKPDTKSKDKKNEDKKNKDKKNKDKNAAGN